MGWNRKVDTHMSPPPHFLYGSYLMKQIIQGFNHRQKKEWGGQTNPLREVTSWKENRIMAGRGWDRERRRMSGKWSKQRKKIRRKGKEERQQNKWRKKENFQRRESEERLKKETKGRRPWIHSTNIHLSSSSVSGNVLVPRIKRWPEHALFLHEASL